MSNVGRLTRNHSSKKGKQWKWMIGTNPTKDRIQNNLSDMEKALIEKRGNVRQRLLDKFNEKR